MSQCKNTERGYNTVYERCFIQLIHRCSLSVRKTSYHSDTQISCICDKPGRSSNSPAATSKQIRSKRGSVSATRAVTSVPQRILCGSRIGKSHSALTAGYQSTQSKQTAWANMEDPGLHHRTNATENQEIRKKLYSSSTFMKWIKFIFKCILILHFKNTLRRSCPV